MCACAVVLKLLRPCDLLRVHYWCRACYATCLLHVCYTKAAVSCPKCVRETLWLRVHYWCRACCATCLLRVCHTKAARSVCMNYVARLLRVHPPAPCLPRVSCNEACIPTSTALVCMMLDASTGLPHACEYVRRHACIANTSGICLSVTLHGWLGRLGDTGCCTIHYEWRCCLVAMATTILMAAC
jgi:hypothetical protein